MKDFFVFSQEETTGLSYFDCVPVAKMEEIKRIFKHFSENEKPYKTDDTACLCVNGKIMHSELFFTPNYNDRGKFIGYRVLVWASRNKK